MSLEIPVSPGTWLWVVAENQAWPVWTVPKALGEGGALSRRQEDPDTPKSLWGDRSWGWVQEAGGHSLPTPGTGWGQLRGPRGHHAAGSPACPGPELGGGGAAQSKQALARVTCFMGSLSASMRFIGLWAPVAPRVTLLRKSGLQGQGEAASGLGGQRQEGSVCLAGRGRGWERYPHSEGNRGWPPRPRVTTAPPRPVPSSRIDVGVPWWGLEGPNPLRCPKAGEWAEHR